MSLDVSLQVLQPCEVVGLNITHNLNSMAAAAGIYQHLWRPEELGLTKAHELVEPLQEGLARLRAEPDKFKALNPTNGWGTYETLCSFVEEYLAGCRKYPQADISVSR